MRLSTLFVSSVLAVAAFALPSSKERFAARMARRANGTSHLQAVAFDPSTAPRSKYSSRPKITSANHTSFSSNWAGAVLNEGPGTWFTVQGTWEVPSPGPGPFNANFGAASSWVGIDGDTCGNAILQTGVDMIYDNGKASFQAWYEWFPAFAQDFSLLVGPGDHVTAIVEATSPTTGTAILINNSSGEEVSVQLSSASALCQQDAEWIVEDYQENGSMVPLANFGTVTFFSATAETVSGELFGTASANIFDIEQGGSVLTDSQVGVSLVTISPTFA
ncbi:peptidase G1 domain-containing protein [Phanerochaete sordida]|uniref:Peptidase G1 domain-containing protein n=1 Tax=Phanerochaete sordida TaxID=48140 RepID=A0A9P3GMV2_9APHY|nr:peptidase G1 domain-containing protein [Phanerochaete sordida]